MTIRFQLQTEDTILFNKHGIARGGNEHKVVVRTTKLKSKRIHLCHSHSL